VVGAVVVVGTVVVATVDEGPVTEVLDEADGQGQPHGRGRHDGQRTEQSSQGGHGPLRLRGRPRLATRRGGRVALRRDRWGDAWEPWTWRGCPKGYSRWWQGPQQGLP
jgi:hypothetical protein